MFVLYRMYTLNNWNENLDPNYAAGVHISVYRFSYPTRGGPFKITRSLIMVQNRPTHTAQYQFQMPLKEDDPIFLFWSSFTGKSGKRKKILTKAIYIRLADKSHVDGNTM